MTAQEKEGIQELLNDSKDMTLQEFAAEAHILSLSMQGLEECKRGKAIPGSEVLKMMEDRWLKR